MTTWQSLSRSSTSVRIAYSNNQNSASGSDIAYTVPTGKCLVIVRMDYRHLAPASSTSTIKEGVSGIVLADSLGVRMYTATDTYPYQQGYINKDMFFKSAETITWAWVGTGGRVYVMINIEGYLIDDI